MTLPAPLIHRRRILLGAGAAGFASSLSVPALAQAQRREWSFSQLVDASPGQQDVSKDFVVGVRAAIAEVNKRGGVRGRTVQHSLIETDGSAASVKAGLLQARGSSQTMGLFGTVGDRAASIVTEELSANTGQDLCQCAPWLMAAPPGGVSTFSLFATRTEQIAYAVNSLSVIGVRQAAAIYADREEARAHSKDVQAAAAALQVSVREYVRVGEWSEVAARVRQEPAPMLLFVGGTPELIGFAKQLGDQPRQRFLIGLADVNLQVVQQLGVPKGLTTVATQVVPSVSSQIGVVRKFRQALARFFDEAPSAQSLSGYISARTALDVVSGAEGPPSREAFFSTQSKRTGVEFDGLALLRHSNDKRKPFVTLSMLSAEGRWM